MRVLFNDREFRTAEHFRQAFLESILTTEVFVPIISTNALDRMTYHNPQEVDNLLIDWLTALLLIKFPDLVSCGSLFPICFIILVCLEDRSRRSYFSMSTSLSKVVPNATIKVLKALLVSRGVGVVGVCMETWNELILLVSYTSTSPGYRVAGQIR
jgi:hypothetical protein